MINKEEEKKTISEYVQLFSTATKQRKSKNTKLALSIYTQCLDLISKINNIEKICESNFFIAQCSFKLNDIEKSKEHYSSSMKLIDKVNRQDFPFYKMKGRLIAKMIHVFFSLNQSNECCMFINQNMSSIASEYTLVEKLSLFYYFIKELLYPLKKGKRLSSFISDYLVVKNDILYNNEKGINPKLKSSFTNLLNSSTKQTLFDKNNILFYMTKYKIPSNHPIILFFEKNQGIFEDNNPMPKIKMTFDMYLKGQKVKFESEELKNVTSVEILQEAKTRVEDFNKIFSLLKNSLSIVFKANFDVRKSNLSLQLHSSQSVAPKKMRNSVALKSSNLEDQFGHNKPFTPNNNSNKDLQGKRFALEQSKNSISNEQVIPESTRHHKSAFNLIDENFLAFKEMKNYSFNNLSSSNLSELCQKNTNDYDTSRCINKSHLSSQGVKQVNRNLNIFLFTTLLDEYEKNRQPRECDLVKMKLPNYVTSYSKVSNMGKHIKYGEGKDVNQDVCFIYKDFLLIQNIFLFGVCDGHGVNGEVIANYASKSIPSYIHYIEIDNNVTKRNKSVNNIITSLYSLNERSNVREMNIIKYFYDKFTMNYNDISTIKPSFHDISDVLKEAFENAQDDLKKLKGEIDIDNSGSTVCMLLLLAKKLIVSNLGDSRAILCSYNELNNKWKSHQLTKDHKPYDKEELIRIEKSGGKVHRCRNEDDDKDVGPYRVWFKDYNKGPGLAMSRSFGDNSAKKVGVIAEPDIFEYSIEKKDKAIVVASDGVWEYMSNDDVMNVIIKEWNRKGDAFVASEMICKEAEERWSNNNSKTRDDITCVVLFLNVIE